MNRACAFAMVLVVLTSAVRAQDADATVEARTRYERGLELFEEERYDAALAEFDRAYEIAPSYQVLFNIARIHAVRGNAVEAVRAYVRYLAEGGERIRARERRRVEQELERQRTRIATVRVESSRDGATVSVDGVDAGTTPLVDPLRVNSGEHVIGLRAPGYEEQTRQVQLAGGTEAELTFELRAAGHGVLRVTSPLPGVTVLVDDRPVGTTPLDTTVPVEPGQHVVLGRRRGYHDARSNIDVELDAELRVELTPLRDPSATVETGQLRVHTPRGAPSIARVDGQVMNLDGDLDLPAGAHAIRLEVADREPWSGQAYVEPGHVEHLEPTLRWTPEERSARLDAAATLRTAGIGLSIGGAVLAVAGLVPAIWNELRSPDAEAEFSVLEECARMAGPGGDPDLFCPDFRIREPANAALRQEILDLRVVTFVGIATGLVGVAVGLFVWSSAPSEEDIDDSASAHLDVYVGPNHLTLAGRF